MKQKFYQAAKKMGVEIVSFRSERHDGAQIYFIVTSASPRQLEYGYFIGEPDPKKERMITDFKEDIQSLISKIESNGR